MACSLKDSHGFLIQSLPLYKSCLLPVLLNEDIVCIKKAERIYLRTLFADKYSGLFEHLSIFSIIH